MFVSFFLILLALAENQLGRSDCAPCWLMAWSHSKLPDALAFACGWSSTSVMSSLCDSQGSPLLAGSAVHTWLACLVWDHSFYCAPRSQTGRLDRAQILTEPEPRQPPGLLARLVLLHVVSCCLLLGQTLSQGVSGSQIWRLGRVLRLLEMCVCVRGASLSAGTLQLTFLQPLRLQQRMGLNVQHHLLVAVQP